LPAIREGAERVLATRVSSDRAQALAQYAAAKDMTGNLARGEALFNKHCAACHRLEGLGHAVGPDLAGLSDRSFDAILVAVLDPNRAVEDKFLEYVAVLADGRIQRGILTTESSNSITLLAQEAKETPVLRSDLELLSSTGKSLMPEGVEKDISPQDMADLILFVQSVEGQPKSFPGNEPRVAHVRDDGSIRLLATECRIYGPSVVFEDLYRNLGFWASPQDRAVWDIQVPQAGPYRVVLDYACDDATAGNRFMLTVADQTLSGRVEGSGGWDNYRRMTAGQITLPAGPARLTFRSDGPIEQYLIDLREIVLDP
jgi:putative heme-binding domain-containing protein